jgi:hypothetical protein
MQLGQSGADALVALSRSLSTLTRDTLTKDTSQPCFRRAAALSVADEWERLLGFGANCLSGKEVVLCPVQVPLAGAGYHPICNLIVASKLAVWPGDKVIRLLWPAVGGPLFTQSLWRGWARRQSVRLQLSPFASTRAARFKTFNVQLSLGWGLGRIDALANQQAEKGNRNKARHRPRFYLTFVDLQLSLVSRAFAVHLRGPRGAHPHNRHRHLTPTRSHRRH